MQDVENWNGLTNDGIDKLMSDIIDYAEKNNKILNQISDLVDQTKTYFSCSSGDKFREQYELLKIADNTINKNILSYNTDLINVKKNYQLRKETGVEILNDGNRRVVANFEKKGGNLMATDLGIDSLSIGVSLQGMLDYKEALKAELLTTTIDKIHEEYENIMNVINTGWQGVSRNRFEAQFKTMCEAIGTDLTAEYADLEARLDELQAFYFDQDQKVIEE